MAEPQHLRQPGTLQGRIAIADDFDQVDDLIADLFERPGSCPECLGDPCFCEPYEDSQP